MDDIVKEITAPFILSAGWIVSFVLALFLIHQYSNLRTQNLFATISTLAIWFLSFVTIFLLPVDVSSAFYNVCLKSFTGNGGGLNDTETSCSCSGQTCGDAYAIVQCDKPYSFICGLPLKIMWYIIYWVFFVLSWVVLPLVQSYVIASYFNVWKKVLRSIVENVVMYATLLVVFLILLISLLVKNVITFSDLPLLIATASNMWGLLILMLLLGYGLVEVPRWLLDASRVQYSLNRCYFRAAKLYEEMTEANEHLEEITERVKKLAQTLRYNDPLRKYIDVIIKKFPEDVRKSFSKGQDDFEDFKEEHREDVLTKSSLEGVLKKAINGNRLSQSTKVQWIILADETLALEDLIVNANSSNKHFQSSIRGPATYPKWTKGVPVDRFLSALEWYWKIWLRPWFYRALFVLTTAVSLVIVWSEVTLSITHPRLSIFAIFVYTSHEQSSYAGILIISMLVVGYMSICSYFTLFKIRIFNLYHLVPRHLTDEYSLLFSAVILSRLALPVCLNYLYMINVIPIKEDNAYTETAFAEATGIAKWLTDASNSTRFNNPILQFNNYYPALIPIICLTTVFSLGTRIASCCGYQKFLGGDEYSEDYIAEGKALMKRERRLRERKLRENGREEDHNHRRARLQMTLDLMKEANSSRPRSRPAEDKPSRFAQLMSKVRGGGEKGDSKPVPAVKYSSRRRHDEEMGQDSSADQGDEVNLIPMEERRLGGDHVPSRGSGVDSSKGRAEGASRSTYVSTRRDSSPKAAAKKTTFSEGTSRPVIGKPPANYEPKSSSGSAPRPTPGKSFAVSSGGGGGASKAPPTSISIPRPKPSAPSSIDPKPSLSRPAVGASGGGGGGQRKENPRDLFSNI